MIRVTIGRLHSITLLRKTKLLARGIKYGSFSLLVFFLVCLVTRASCLAVPVSTAPFIDKLGQLLKTVRLL